LAGLIYYSNGGLFKRFSISCLVFLEIGSTTAIGGVITANLLALNGLLTGENTIANRLRENLE